ncbi:MAG: hypothetical protein A2087_00995 [Spirochaetes bacterium GWD1_61_31]|nr:MAG: hypothetical protein A2Y37_13880 [Spirochaetes bacterium GWB1_60_80]OHD32686.1 MAG: hypothetical protein A2004_02435 [Spirochaetes bacterium GWC1_61_12]OHD42071.1 MAG: hypothetical protein A2Y35_07405 [Spirochaetes bacterium GWE1_60_18]OHD43358.1 MAG: hypothetical protein A2087_00995 [Spirochaetes bacterium GWD1_61_31]OHD60995.1 MAG: hypothetical protein A2Y32_03505 [Spirochaetes bacterium GWF1_60_12]HAP43235.1 hypothetical protein [Spirochaetaceae bacterium]
MKHLFCDVCKREVVDPIPMRTFYHVREFDLCENCRDDLEAATKFTVRTRQPFDFAWFQKMQLDLIKIGIAKNRIPVGK